MIGVVFLSCILLNVEGLYVLSDWGDETLEVRGFRVGNVKEKVGQLARSMSASRTCSLCEQKSSPRRGQDANSTVFRNYVRRFS